VRLLSIDLGSTGGSAYDWHRQQWLPYRDVLDVLRAPIRCSKRLQVVYERDAYGARAARGLGRALGWWEARLRTPATKWDCYYSQQWRKLVGDYYHSPCPTGRGEAKRWAMGLVPAATTDHDAECYLLGLAWRIARGLS